MFLLSGHIGTLQSNSAYTQMHKVQINKLQSLFNLTSVEH